MRILKYEVLPEGAIVAYKGPFFRVLQPIVQNGKIQVYIETLEGIEDHPYEEETTVRFVTLGTGWTIDDTFLLDWTYIGTVTLDEFVWHIYYSQEVEEGKDDKYQSTEEA